MVLGVRETSICGDLTHALWHACVRIERPSGIGVIPYPKGAK